MLQKIQQMIVSKINQFPILKKSLLKCYDFYHYSRPFVVGTLTRYPAYFRNILNSKVVAKPGTLGFKGGAFNPGVLELENNDLILLSKAQVLPWYKAKGKKQKYYLQGNPVSFLLNSETLETKDSFIVTQFLGFGNEDEYAIEDCRMFWWKGKKMVNHSWIVKQKILSGQQTVVKSALSFFDEKAKKIEFIGFPQLDFPIEDVEKNWVYKEYKNELFLFYSLHPYRVLELDDENDLRFKTFINQDLSKKIQDPGGFGTRISFSSNPIDFDEKYWLVIIHQIKFQITGRCYYHWAVLIDKETKLPVKMTSKPIFSGMGARGRVPGYRYISSVLKRGDELLFFAGEGDIYVTVTKKKIKEIENLLMNI